MMDALKPGDVLQITIDWRGVSVSGIDIAEEDDVGVLLLVAAGLKGRRELYTKRVP